jgi:predicted PhzF superfamily epimerase YddE/YHI9
MNFTVYQVDAFTSGIFGGNPAAIMPVDARPSSHTCARSATVATIAAVKTPTSSDIMI